MRTLDRKHLKSICQEILRRNLKINWQSPAHVDQVTKELLGLMKESGCQILRFGVESGNQSILDIIDKKTTLNQIENAFLLRNKIGIDTVAYFIIGYLGEMEGTIRETVAFTKKLSPTYTIFFPAIPMPQTPLFESSVQVGLVEDGYWRDFILGKRNDSLPFLFPRVWERILKAYCSLYFRPSYILKSLSRINSWMEIPEETCH